MKGTVVMMVLVTTGFSSSMVSKTCPSYTAGHTGTTPIHDSSSGKIYLNEASIHRAQCAGTVYAWHYCYYDNRRTNNLEVAFGAYEAVGEEDEIGYNLHSGSYYLLHLDSRESSFTCGIVNLEEAEYFQINDGDRLGACLRDNDNAEFLDILAESAPNNFSVRSWGSSSGQCQESDMMQSQDLSTTPGMVLHLYVDINFDECALGWDNCYETFATCTDVVGAENSFICTCNPGYTGSGVTCTNINGCEDGTNSCNVNAECTNTGGSYTCSCSPGYTGDGMNCTDINECEGSSDLCHSNATCINTPGSYVCSCNDGYSRNGSFCADIDECGDGTNSCNVNAECTNTGGSYTCSCSSGYTGDGMRCIDIDECLLSNACHSDASCQNTKGSFICQCKIGYSGDGLNCSDIDECSADMHTCATDATCMDIDGSYTCDCNAGYIGDGFTCIYIDVCSSNKHGCAAEATCTDTMDIDGSYTCDCNAGYTGDGFTCANINECSSNEHNCAAEATCTDSYGSYLCTCNTGYTGNGNTCNDIDECERGTATCDVNAECTNTDGNYTCSCSSGYSGNGMICTDVDECEDGNNSCDMNANCANIDGSYTCSCQPGYTGDGLNCRDECTDSTSVCNGADGCENMGGSYVCLCGAGLSWNGTFCEAVPDIASPEGQKGDDNEIGTGFIVGIAVGGVVILAIVLVVGVVCAVKVRTHSRSKSLPVHDHSIGYDNRVYGVVDGNIQMDTPSKDQYEEQSLTNRYDYVSDPVAITDHKATAQTPLEYYSAIDYYSTINECSSTEQDYDGILKKAEISGAVGSEGADLYYSPAQREDELYQQLQRQRIKAIPKSHIEQLGKLGSGEFGTVCKGRWKYSDQVLDVAIKALSNASDESSKVKFLQEAAIMSQFRHPNVIKLYGVICDADQVMLVVELLEKGDLFQVLAKMRPDPGQLHNPDLPLTLLSFSRQTALGMVYLAGKGFVHRDIAARNILLSKNNICKICDFGMSRDLEDDSYYVSHGGKVPVKWTAPEAIVYKKYSTASDVWSYGCLLYEIWSLGHKPFEGVTNQEALMKVESGYRLPPPAGCPKAIHNLMMDCWNPNPASRPVFRQILLSLLGDDNSLLMVPEEDKATHSLAGVLGSPLKAGYSMYLSEQHRYQAGSNFQMTKM